MRCPAIRNSIDSLRSTAAARTMCCPVAVKINESVSENYGKRKKTDRRRSVEEIFRRNRQSGRGDRSSSGPGQKNKPVARKRPAKCQSRRDAADRSAGDRRKRAPAGRRTIV